MKRIRRASVVTIWLLFCCLLVGLIITLDNVNDNLLADSFLRLYLDGSVAVEKVITQLNTQNGVIAVRQTDPDEVLAEFEAVIGYPWPQTYPLPDFLDVTIKPTDASAVAAYAAELDGIDYVAYPEQTIDHIANIYSQLQSAQALLLVLLVSTACLGALSGYKTWVERLRRCAA